MPLHLPLRICIFFSGATSLDLYLGLPTIVDLAALAKIRSTKIGGFLWRQQKAHPPVLQTSKIHKNTQIETQTNGDVHKEWGRKSNIWCDIMEIDGILCAGTRKLGTMPQVWLAPITSTQKTSTVLAHHWKCTCLRFKMIQNSKIHANLLPVFPSSSSSPAQDLYKHQFSITIFLERKRVFQTFWMVIADDVYPYHCFDSSHVWKASCPFPAILQICLGSHLLMIDAFCS